LTKRLRGPRLDGGKALDYNVIMDGTRVPAQRSPLADAEPEAEVEEMCVDGRWVGPPSLRLFVRANRFFVAFWFFILTFMSVAFWFDPGGISSLWLAVPLAVITGGTVTLAFMFAFSRGWISEGD
jgi:hypothetical protein